MSDIIDSLNLLRQHLQSDEKLRSEFFAINDNDQLIQQLAKLATSLNLTVCEQTWQEVIRESQRNWFERGVP